MHWLTDALTCPLWFMLQTSQDLLMLVELPILVAIASSIATFLVVPLTLRV